MMVEISTEDIRCGLGGSAEECAIARALQRVTGDKDALFGGTVAVYGGVSCTVPRGVQIWARNFDRWCANFRGASRPRPIRFEVP